MNARKPVTRKQRKRLLVAEYSRLRDNRTTSNSTEAVQVVRDVIASIVYEKQRRW